MTINKDIDGFLESVSKKRAHECIPEIEGRAVNDDLKKDIESFFEDYSESIKSMSDNTRKDYINSHSRMTDSGGFSPQQNKNTHYKNLAAWKFGETLEAMDELKSGNIKESAIILLELKKTLETPWSKISGDEKIDGKGTKSNKRAMSKMPQKWREKMFNAASEQYKFILAVLEFTGCRPSELENGIKLKAVDGQIAAFILGAKTKEATENDPAHGHKIRSLSREIGGNPRFEFLYKMIRKTVSGEVLEYKKKSSAVRSRVSDLGKTLWPGRASEARPSAYSYRHLLATEMKSTSMPEVTIAEALGHASVTTQTHYGHYARKSAKSVGIKQVKTDGKNPVRTRKTTRKPVLKS